METKTSQIQWVKEQLGQYGEISRNTCLKAYISRLGAIIQKLEYQGYTFKPERRKGDYVYVMTAVPTRKVYEYVNEGGMMKPVQKMIPV